MKISKFAVTAAALLFAISCERHPTAPADELQASFDLVDPVVATFSVTQGLPDAPLPDSLKLTAAQKTQIQALVAAFATANAADLAAMRTALQAARAAKQAGKSRTDIQAILAGGKAAADRVHAAGAALQDAIKALLTPAQQAWLAAHRPDHPPRTP